MKDLQGLQVDDILENIVHFHSIPKAKIEKSRHNISILRRCKFTLKDKKKFVALVELLKEFNDNLREFCPREESDKIDRGMLQVLSRQNNPNDLRQLGEA